jgi:hypothetical protein
MRFTIANLLVRTINALLAGLHSQAAIMGPHPGFSHRKAGCSGL